VAERAARGVDVLKIMAGGGAMTPGTDAARPQFSAESVKAVVQEAHAHGLRVSSWRCLDHGRIGQRNLHLPLNPAAGRIVRAG